MLHLGLGWLRLPGLAILAAPIAAPIASSVTRIGVIVATLWITRFVWRVLLGVTRLAMAPCIPATTRFRLLLGKGGIRLEQEQEQ